MTKYDKPAARRSPAPQEGYRKPAVEVVDPRWLVKAFGLMVAVCLVFAYISLCVLFYHAQWQLVLHPSRAEAHTPAEYGLKASEITYGDLHGWMIPADEPGAPVVLMLPSGDGSASDSLQRASTFHAAHLYVVLFDYRGYGMNAERHPTQMMMEADSQNALSYVVRNQFTLDRILLYGNGLGASLAARLCELHPKIAALVLESASGDMAKSASEDSRARLVPFRWLFHEDFALASRLENLKTPKLLVAYPNGMNLQQASDPKMIVDLPAAADEKDFREALQRFLDSYVMHPASVVTPGGG